MFYKFLTEPFNPYKIKRFSFGKNHSKKALHVFQKHNLICHGYSYEIDTYGIRHSLLRHSKDKIPLILDDFYFIPIIITIPDIVTYEGLSNIKTHIIKYQKTINGVCYCYITEIRTGRKTISLKTFYKKETL